MVKLENSEEEEDENEDEEDCPETLKLRNEPNLFAKNPMNMHKCPKKRTQFKAKRTHRRGRSCHPERVLTTKGMEILRSFRTGSEPGSNLLLGIVLNQAESD